MASAKKIKSKVTRALELPKEIVFDMPLITLTGSEELNIENYKGIVEYGDERIRLKITGGILKIEGRALALRQITKEAVEITGAIRLIEFMK